MFIQTRLKHRRGLESRLDTKIILLEIWHWHLTFDSINVFCSTLSPFLFNKRKPFHFRNPTDMKYFSNKFLSFKSNWRALEFILTSMYLKIHLFWNYYFSVEKFYEILINTSSRLHFFRFWFWYSCRLIYYILTFQKYQGRTELNIDMIHSFSPTLMFKMNDLLNLMFNKMVKIHLVLWFQSIDLKHKLFI